MKDGFSGIRRYGFSGVTNKMRAARRSALRGTERVLNSHGWQTIKGIPEYIGKGPLARPHALHFHATNGVPRITEHCLSELNSTITFREVARG